MKLEKEFEEFWLTYPSDLCGGTRNKGAKGQAKKAYEKKIKTLEHHKKLMRNMRELMLQDRKVSKAGGNPYRWPFASTFLNQDRWDVEMESTSERLEEAREQYCDCGNPDPRIPLGGKIVNNRLTYGKRVCVECYRRQEAEHNAWLNEQNIKIGMGIKPNEKKEDYYTRCRDWVKRNGEKGIMGKVVS